MVDNYEACRTQCKQEHELWHHDYRAWMDEYKNWKDCEQKVVGLMYELQSALPDHRMQLDQFSEMNSSFARLLEAHKANFDTIRTSMIDADCPTDLKTFQQIGVSRCRECEPQCAEGLLESHRRAARSYAKLASERVKLKAEFESALPQLQQLVSRLQVYLNISE